MLNRIYALLAILLTVSILLTGLIAVQFIRTYHDQRTESQLLSAARLIQYRLQDDEDPEQAATRALKVYAEDAGILRLTIINRQGLVIYDNAASAADMDNHLYRPEIAHAFRTGETGMAIRRSSTLAEEMLYLSVYDSHHDWVIRTALPLSAHQAGIRELILTILAILVVVLVLMSLIAVFSARIITRPLYRLKRAATAISAGDYSARVPVQPRDDGEVTALSQAFNHMADQLQDIVSDLEDKNVRLDAMLNAINHPLLAVDAELAVRFLNQPARTLFDRHIDPDEVIYPLLLITHNPETEKLARSAISLNQFQSSELNLQTREGEQLYQVSASPFMSSRSEGAIISFYNVSEARKLQKMRSDFVANVTHELRTPLTSIRGFIETLREGAIHNPDVADRFLDIIDIEADRLHRLISDILVLAEIEDLANERDQESFDLNDLIEDVAVLLDESAAARKIRIRLQDTESPLLVLANRYRIKQILINLADNAIKYNREGGSVEIQAMRHTPERVDIIVKDTGYGIPREHIDRIFERFYRVDKGRSREMGGTGLGLSIVKHIVQLYGGSTEVESHLGEGSVFKVSLKI